MTEKTGLPRCCLLGAAGVVPAAAQLGTRRSAWARSGTDKPVTLLIPASSSKGFASIKQIRAGLCHQPFAPLRVRNLNLANRIVISPMCQYSLHGVNGKA